MESLKQWIDELAATYKEHVYITKPHDKKELSSIIPNELHSLYALMDKADLPFGYIFSIDRALEESRQQPFAPDWFVFGRDNYFSYWLCSYKKDENGRSFTSWDHESGSVIGKAADEDIVSFLKDEKEEYDDFMETMRDELEDDEDEDD